MVGSDDNDNEGGGSCHGILVIAARLVVVIIMYDGGDDNDKVNDGIQFPFSTSPRESNMKNRDLQGKYKVVIK